MCKSGPNLPVRRNQFRTKQKSLRIVDWWQDKAVLEPRVSAAFAITYFCNHCNIRFENTSKYVDTLTLFSKNLNQRSLTPRWPLTPCLLRSHVWLYPRIIVSKSHDNTSMYVDTVINFAKYHIHNILRTYYVHTTYMLRTYYVHTTYRMSDHIVSYWTQFRRDKKLLGQCSLWTYEINLRPRTYQLGPKNLKGGIRPLFDFCINAIG